MDTSHIQQEPGKRSDKNAVNESGNIGIRHMFIFHWIGVFSSSYLNGLADGFTLCGLFCLALRFLTCHEEIRSGMRSLSGELLTQIGMGRAKEAAEIALRLRNQIPRDILPDDFVEYIDNRIDLLLDRLREKDDCSGEIAAEMTNVITYARLFHFKGLVRHPVRSFSAHLKHD